jgi:hypothetical protein
VKTAHIARASVLQVALKRLANGIHTPGVETIDDRQRIADTFYRLGFLPAAVWNRTP